MALQYVVRFSASSKREERVLQWSLALYILFVMIILFKRHARDAEHFSVELIQKDGNSVIIGYHRVNPKGICCNQEQFELSEGRRDQEMTEDARHLKNLIFCKL